MKPRIVERAEIEAALEGIDLVAMTERALVAYSEGRAQVAAVGELLFEAGEAHIKSGCLAGAPYFVVKVATGFYANPARGLASSLGIVLVFDAATGEPRGVLADEGFLTDVRTAAAGATAARRLAAPDVARIAILGAGIQARLQLEHLRAVTPCRNAAVWARRPEAARALADYAEGLGFDVEVATSPGEAARGARLIVTTTPAAAPLLDADDVAPGTHITAVGADTPGKGELSTALIARAGGLFADSRLQARERGELRRAPAGAAIVELGEVIAGAAAGRASAEAITICDLTGVAAQDAAIAGEVMAALAAGLPAPLQRARPSDEPGLEGPAPRPRPSDEPGLEGPAPRVEAGLPAPLQRARPSDEPGLEGPAPRPRPSGEPDLEGPAPNGPGRPGSFPIFELERNQSLYENEVEFNLTESGVEPLPIGELLSADEQAQLMAMRPGYGHTEGTPQLRAAIATWYPGADAANVLVTTGAAEANFLAYWTLMRAGDAMAMMLPNFMQLKGLAAAFGHQVRPFHLAAADRGWALDLASLKAACAPDDVRLIAVCNPNNPTGAILTEAEMDAIVAAARARDAWIFSDEIYRGSEMAGAAETASFFGRYDKVIVTSSTSKSLAHAGLRIGWTVAPPAMISEFVQRQDYTTIGTGPVNQYLAARLLEPARREAILARSRSIIGANLEIIAAWVGRWNGRLSWRAPQAGGMAFVAYDFAIGSGELSARIRKEQSVFVVAGDWFGMDRCLRIGTGGEADRLEAALRRVDLVLGGV